MKKTYAKPKIEIEVYELNAAIAANCGDVINLGPEAPGHTICEDYGDSFDVTSFRPHDGAASILTTGVTPFYDDKSADCDCYYSSGGYGYFTS